MSAKLQARLRTVRAKLKLTQKELAQKLGVPYSNLRDWEQNVSTPSALALEALESKLAALLGSGGK